MCSLLFSLSNRTVDISVKDRYNVFVLAWADGGVIASLQNRGSCTVTTSYGLQVLAAELILGSTSKHPSLLSLVRDTSMVIVPGAQSAAQWELDFQLGSEPSPSSICPLLLFFGEPLVDSRLFTSSSVVIWPTGHYG